jgi:glutamate-1-semialdehyde 2,1-aminomutase
MLSLVASGEHHRVADALNESLIGGLNGVLASRRVAGSVYGLASYFHIVLGHDAARPTGGIEWPRAGADPPRTASAVTLALRRAMLKHGVDLMGGSGGMIAAVHTEEDVEQTVEAFEATVGEMQAEGLL